MKQQPGNTGLQPRKSKDTGNTGSQPGKNESTGNTGLQPGKNESTGNTGLQPGKENHAYKGWYSRGYLPHLDAPALLQSITFRLADSLPQERLRQLEQELATKPENEREKWKRQRIEAWLDAGMGCCALRHPRLAALMQNTLWYFDGSRYRLLAWCVMPNHVHVLIEQQALLSK
ncbi:hypothetical protein SAMN02746041_00502, partial [Desulfacinum hydrothermale DSM 13146]